MEEIIILKAFEDNYIYLYRYDDAKVIAIDPGDGEVVVKALNEKGLELSHILITHSHFDHIGGVEMLKRKTGCVSLAMKDEQSLTIGSSKVETIATPGHTKDSVCYYITPSNELTGILLTGDTLFTGGCGRPMSCKSSVLWNSLCKLAQLPGETLMYPGHNYTIENYEFALSIIPSDQTIKNAFANAQKLEDQGKDIIPSTLNFEKKTNIFLKSSDREVKKALKMQDNTAGEVFAELRMRKNIFG
ncbi:MAG: hydroxyacylglutathione hydrolase [Sedimentisphaeraceae bacterium JB056]